MWHSGRMPDILIVADRATLDGATDLIDRFGDGAGPEAAARADHSREVGNVIHFCHWRQIERFIVAMAIDLPFGTLH